jgi:hypothetical protein
LYKSTHLSHTTLSICSAYLCPTCWSRIEIFFSPTYISSDIKASDLSVVFIHHIKIVCRFYLCLSFWRELEIKSSKMYIFIAKRKEIRERESIGHDPVRVYNCILFVPSLQHLFPKKSTSRGSYILYQHVWKCFWFLHKAVLLQKSLVARSKIQAQNKSSKSNN